MNVAHRLALDNSWVANRNPQWYTICTVSESGGRNAHEATQENKGYAQG